MAKRESVLFVSKRSEYRAVRDATQSKINALLRQRMELILQIAITGLNLQSRRLVLRRQTFYGVRDPATGQRQIIIGRRRYSRAREPEFVQGLV